MRIMILNHALAVGMLAGAACIGGLSAWSCKATAKALSDNATTVADKSERVEGGKGNFSAPGGTIVTIGNAPLAGCGVLALLGAYILRNSRRNFAALKKVTKEIEVFRPSKDERFRELKAQLDLEYWRRHSADAVVESLKHYAQRNPGRPIDAIIHKAVQAATSGVKQ